MDTLNSNFQTNINHHSNNEKDIENSTCCKDKKIINNQESSNHVIIKTCTMDNENNSNKEFSYKKTLKTLYFISYIIFFFFILFTVSLEIILFTERSNKLKYIYEFFIPIEHFLDDTNYPQTNLVDKCIHLIIIIIISLIISNLLNAISKIIIKKYPKLAMYYSFFIIFLLSLAIYIQTCVHFGSFRITELINRFTDNLNRKRKRSELIKKEFFDSSKAQEISDGFTKIKDNILIIKIFSYSFYIFSYLLGLMIISIILFSIFRIIMKHFEYQNITTKNLKFGLIISNTYGRILIGLCLIAIYQCLISYKYKDIKNKRDELKDGYYKFLYVINIGYIVCGIVFLYYLTSIICSVISCTKFGRHGGNYRDFRISVTKRFGALCLKALPFHISGILISSIIAVGVIVVFQLIIEMVKIIPTITTFIIFISVILSPIAFCICGCNKNHCKCFTLECICYSDPPYVQHCMDDIYYAYIYKPYNYIKAKFSKLIHGIQKIIKVVVTYIVKVFKIIKTMIINILLYKIGFMDISEIAIYGITNEYTFPVFFVWRYMQVFFAFHNSAIHFLLIMWVCNFMNESVSSFIIYFLTTLELFISYINYKPIICDLIKNENHRVKNNSQSKELN